MYRETRSIHVLGLDIPRKFWWALGVLLLYIPFFFRYTRCSFSGDFKKSYYPAGSLIFDNPFALYDWGEQIGFVNLPIFAYLFTPAALLEIETAKVLMAIAGVIISAYCAHYLIRYTNVDGWRKSLIILLFLLNGPLMYSVKLGNLSHLVLLMLIAVLFTLREKKDIFSGILLGVIALIKLPLVLLGGYFVLRRRWKIVGGMVGAIGMLTVASLLMFGIELHQLWWEKSIRSYMEKPVAAFNAQSVTGFLLRFTEDVDLVRWNQFEMSPVLQVVRYVVVGLLYIIVGWVLWRKPAGSLSHSVEALEVSLVLCLAIVVSPVAWTHYYLFLIIPVALYLGNAIAIPQEIQWKRWMMVGAILISLPVVYLRPPWEFALQIVTKLLISNFLLGGLLLLGVLVAARRWVHRSPLHEPGGTLNGQFHSFKSNDGTIITRAHES